jgi:hypothetical protein
MPNLKDFLNIYVWNVSTLYIWNKALPKSFPALYNEYTV